jgi:4'-phosphopantetheinyl transferase
MEAAVAAPVRASSGHVDIWVLALQPAAGEQALRTLSGQEREFASRLRVGAPLWVAARAALRGVLGRYLGLAPERVALEPGPNGKPRLAPGAPADIRFNLSHSGHVALVGVRLGREVGVDVEAMRPGVDGDAIARELFGAPERADMAGAPAGKAGEAFFRTWVRREALAKASGLGIALPSPSLTGTGFTFRDLDGIPGFAAALASEGDDWDVRHFGTLLAR